MCNNVAQVDVALLLAQQVSSCATKVQQSCTTIINEGVAQLKKYKNSEKKGHCWNIVKYFEKMTNDGERGPKDRRWRGAEAKKRVLEYSVICRWLLCYMGYPLTTCIRDLAQNKVLTGMTSTGIHGLLRIKQKKTDWTPENQDKGGGFD